ncbi:hypothetical protein BAC3_02154 [uncultured bacterium]|nr:hypothetical protein BAC3_02154 [uncultured bacterium]
MGPFELLQGIVEILERLQIPYLITWSVAAMAYGESRLTNDIDIIDIDYITQWADRLGIRDIWDAVLKRVKE